MSAPVDVLATLATAERWIDAVGSGEAPELARDVRAASVVVRDMAESLRRVLPVIEAIQPQNNMRPEALRELARWAREARAALAAVEPK